MRDPNVVPMLACEGGVAALDWLAGARILSGLEYGEPARRYGAKDLEGHRWMLMQRERGET